MKHFKIHILLLLFIVFLLSSCVRHVEFIQPDMHQHSSTVPLRAAFYMDSNLKGIIYSARAASSGIANRWDIPVGDVVNKYAISQLSNGFTGFKEIDSLSGNDYDVLIKVVDIQYNMAGQAAHSDLTFIVESFSGKELLKNNYPADGPSGYGRILLGGAFAQKSAIRQSTHVVMETIFNSLMDDIRANYNNWEL